LSTTAVRDDPSTSSHAWRRHTARFHSNLLTDATSRGWRRITLLHRRAGLRETMSDYLIRDLERYGVAIRDRSEIAELHGADGELEAVTLRSGERLAFSFLFLFLGALPCTDWLADVVARTGTASSSRVPTRAVSPCSKPAFRASSQPVTSARGRASAAPPRWAKERWPCSSSTLGWRWGLARNGLQPRDRRRTPYRNGSSSRGGPRGARTRRRTYDPPTTHASIAERDDIEVGLNRRVATRPAASPAS
jgi:hypothetical protein